MSLTSDLFVISFCTKRVAPEKKADLRDFVRKRVKAGEDINCRTIGEWADLFNQSQAASR